MLLSALVPALVLSTGLLSGVGEPEAGRTKQAAVDPGAYASADWPAHNTSLYAENLQGKKLPTALGEETWLTEKQDLEGKVLVLDFWATWCGPCIAAEPKLTALQKKLKDHLVVIGVSGQNEDIETVRSYLDEKGTEHAYVHDAEQRVFKPFKSRGIPLVVVISTDGVVRWMGNPHAPEFDKAVEQTVRVDPGLKAPAKE